MTPSANHYAASAAGTLAPQNPLAIPSARQFTDASEKRVVDLRNNASRDNWVYQTYITDDTEQMSADAEREYASGVAEMARQARRQGPVVADRCVSALGSFLSSEVFGVSRAIPAC